MKVAFARPVELELPSPSPIDGLTPQQLQTWCEGHGYNPAAIVYNRTDSRSRYEKASWGVIIEVDSPYSMRLANRFKPIKVHWLDPDGEEYYNPDDLMLIHPAPKLYQVWNGVYEREGTRE